MMCTMGVYYVIVEVLMILMLASNNNEVHSRENREQQLVLLKLHIVLQQFKRFNVLLIYNTITLLPRLSAKYLYDVTNYCVTIVASHELSHNICRVSCYARHLHSVLYILLCT
jgi:hypothetical protein